ncbi:hypothetical protein [Pseudomonas sp. RW405]|uniref:hypothetical protein n=1 Tax=Pseudomonas sp. RW405 TaxID=2202652 RepID=UPI000D726C2B|nr:hypothetical protein [Pseudomonas sp. RW405]PWY43397.1 hypothetical protein DK184_01055 [Pseudomonas sp. RW405]
MNEPTTNGVRLLAQVKHLLGVRHLVGIRSDAVRGSDEWIWQQLTPLPAGLQYRLLEEAATRLKQTAGRPLEQCGTVDLMASLCWILEQGRAA